MTLVELLVIMGVIGLLVGLGVPAMASYSRQARLKAATRQVVRLLSYTRSLAISSHADHAVVIDSGKQQLQVVNLETGEKLEQIVRLPSSVSLSVSVGGEALGESQIVFRATGSLAGRTTSLVLADQNRSQTITVTGTTGAAIVQ